MRGASTSLLLNLEQILKFILQILYLWKVSYRCYQKHYKPLLSFFSLVLTERVGTNGFVSTLSVCYVVEHNLRLLQKFQEYAIGSFGMKKDGSALGGNARLCV